ncbi:hypothetical protein QJS10_CPA06g02179 [Acorus calamus]|uniref:Uncharacterized protein n=1 Tax=Acorus calamus TaxID=4465 RepID=A0AAV9EIZ0_ACOCL|nr:hypothetical protein QJS10_CPA06g02179 [Acorus calamus]
MMGDRGLTSSTSSATPHADDLEDLVGDSFAHTEFTIEDFFSDVRLEAEMDEQPQQSAQVSDQAPQMPLQTYVRGPRRVWGTSATVSQGSGEQLTTPPQSGVPSTATDVPSSSAPPAPRKTKKKGFMRIFG